MIVELSDFMEGRMVTGLLKTCQRSEILNDAE